MNPKLCFAFLILALNLPLWAGNPRYVKQLPLDELVVYSIPVPFSQGFTTVMFPAAIQNVIASGATSDISKPSQFLLIFKENSHYFSIRARDEKAVSTVNIIFDGVTYVFRFTASNEPYYSVTMFRPNPWSQRTASMRPGVPPSRLDVLCDKAKAYSVLMVHDPGSVADVAYAKPKRIIQYSGFRVLVDEVFRFEVEDTIMFRILLENKTDDEIAFAPEALGVRLGSRIYTASFWETSGVMPPRSLTAAYFSITGTNDGRRNNLSVDNPWNILVPRRQPLEPLPISEPLTQFPAQNNERNVSLVLPADEEAEPLTQLTMPVKPKNKVSPPAESNSKPEELTQKSKSFSAQQPPAKNPKQPRKVLDVPEFLFVPAE